LSILNAKLGPTLPTLLVSLVLPINAMLMPLNSWARGRKSLQNKPAIRYGTRELRGSVHLLQTQRQDARKTHFL
jgi:hypothetical protein